MVKMGIFAQNSVFFQRKLPKFGKTQEKSALTQGNFVIAQFFRHFSASEWRIYR